jgi:hypothetical protein
MILPLQMLHEIILAGGLVSPGLGDILPALRKAGDEAWR